MTRSILIDDSIHDYLGGACVRVHIRASGNYSHGSVRFEASHYSEELTTAKNTVRQTFAKATSKSERLGLLAKMAERLIVSACLTIWQNDVFWGIEIPNEHLWMAQELYTESWRITSSEHDDGRPSDTT